MKAVQLQNLPGRFVFQNGLANVLGKTFLAAIVAIFITTNARANFHLWEVTEIYSNEDGSVQFIELFTTFSGQEVLLNHQIRCSGPSGTNLFTFTNSLPVGTANKAFIIGTSNLSSIPGGVKPDYVMPANFLLRGSGVTNTVNFGLNQNIVTYTNLPTDGLISLVRSFGGPTNLTLTATNSPKNYSNQSNSIVPVKISGVAPSGTNLLFSFIAAKGTNSTTGLAYTVQYKDSLSSPSWLTLTNFPGVTTNTTRTITNGISSSERYYQLKVP